MSWLKAYAKGTYPLFGGNVLAAWQPIDFYHYFPLWYELWVARIANALRQLEAEKKSYAELRDILPGPSSMRSILVKMIPSYMGTSKNNPQDFRLVANFIARMLIEACPGDPFGEHSNPWLQKQEVENILGNQPWKEANVAIARLQGRLITAAGSLVHGLYNDVVTDFGWDAYGPYTVQHNGESYTLLVRHFPNLAPVELWPKHLLSPIREIKIYSLYQEVEWEIKTVGCHTITLSGSPTEGLRQYSIEADGHVLTEKDLPGLIDVLSEKAEAIYRDIRKMTEEELKTKVMLQECCQLKKLFEAADIDWQPTDEMLASTKKPLLKNIIPHDRMIASLAEYENVTGITKFAKEVLNEEYQR